MPGESVCIHAAWCLSLANSIGIAVVAGLALGAAGIATDRWLWKRYKGRWGK